MNKRIFLTLLALILSLAVALTACGTDNGKDCLHEYDNACDTVCNLCDATRETEHAYDNACDTDCNVCGATRVTEHVYDNACDTDCNVCGATRVTEHVYDNACDTDCNVCGATHETKHSDPDHDGICNECTAELEIEIPALTAPTLDLSQIPEYDGSVGYVNLNDGVPFFTENQLTVNAYEHYSELDSLSRCKTAVACLGKELLPEGERGSLSHSPTAWHSGAIYERCHLIAWSLAGENNNAMNLITGTYDLNGVMQTFESLVLDYIRETSNHVMYRVTPVFEGNNLLASGVIMEAWSVEDNGEGMCFSIYIYNAQDDCVIDYSDGDYEDPNAATYIVNKNNYKIHKATCQSVYDMSDKNKLYYYCTLEEVINDLKAQGITSYTYCGNCKPQNG